MPKVGEIFREERERQGLTLRNIEEMTSIRLRYLEAIEAGENSILPGEVYAKGFVRNYAIALGLDGTEFVNLYKIELENPQQDEVVIPDTDTPEPIQPVMPEVVEEVYKEPVQAKVSTANIPKKNTPQPKLRIAPFLVLLGVFICAVLAGVYIVLTFFYNTTPQDVVSSNVATSTTQSQTVQTEKPVEPEVQNQQVTEENIEKFRILNDGKGQITIVPANNEQIAQIEMQADFTGNCWTQVITDGTQAFSGVLRYGSKQTWQAKESIYIKIGNVEAVKITLNGRQIERIADTSPVAEATVTILK